MCVSSFSPQCNAKQEVEKRNSTSEKATIAIVRRNQKLGCVSQDVELPEQAVGPTNVRRSLLKKSGKRFSRAHLELKYTKTANIFIKSLEQLGPSLGIIQGGPKRHRNPSACGQRFKQPVVGIPLRRKEKRS